MDITVDKAVNYSVKKVTVSNLSVTKDNNGKIILFVPYEWYDVNNVLLRNGRNRYTEDILLARFAAAGSDFAPIAAALKSMFLGDAYPNISIMFLKDNKMQIDIIYCNIDNGAKTWHKVRYIDTQVDAYLAAHGLTRIIINGLITSFTLAIFE